MGGSTTGEDDNASASRAGVRLRRAIREHVANVGRKSSKVGRNHLAGRRFLLWGARGATKVSFVSDFVARWDSVIAIMRVKVVGVVLADASEAVVDDPAQPESRSFKRAKASFGAGAPDGVGDHSANRSDMRWVVVVRTNNVCEVLGGGGWESKKRVD